MNDMIIRTADLLENPTPRVPVCLVLDTSGSMSGAPIRELETGVESFLATIRNDEMARHSAEISIVTFNDIAVQAMDFASIDRQQAPILVAGGSTAMGSAVDMALNLLKKRKDEFQASGVDYYQPWLVLMTDGQPTDSIESAVGRCQQMVNERKLSIFAIGIGNEADMNILARFSPKRQPLKLQGLCFSSFFEWLSRSIARVSASIPGEAVPLDVKGLKGWAEI